MKRSGCSVVRGRACAIAVLAVGLVMAPMAARAACTPPVACVGDCDGKGSVSIDEIVKMVSIALGNGPVSACPAGDADCDGSITVDEILAALTKAVIGCPAPVTPVCGNGSVETGEDCDIGGTCIGGSNAGTACTGEAGCQGDGVCFGGTVSQLACANDTVCGGGKCLHCMTFGGSVIAGDSTHTCAQNCTFETAVPVRLQPGDGLGHGSGAIIHNDAVVLPPQLPVPLSGTQTLKIGKMNPTNGLIPVVIPADSVKIPAVSVAQGALCACVRGVAQKTCGGTLFQPDGTPAKDCTVGYTAGDSVCTSAGLPPCTFVNGPGNAASGFIGCGGLPGVDFSFTEDSRGASDPPQCNPFNAAYGPPKPEYPLCGAPPVKGFSGAGGAGSAKILDTLAIALIDKPCTTSSPAFGPDNTFCTDDDPFQPPALRSFPNTLPFVTGVATAQMSNVSGTDNVSMCACTTATAATCAPSDCTGPIGTAGGRLTSCSALIANQDPSGLNLATAFGALSQTAPFYDIVTTVNQIFVKP